MSGFTHLHLDELEDKAPAFGLGNVQEARFAGADLHAEQTGLAYVRMKPDQEAPFAHRHEQQEELYVVLAGSGTATLDGERIEIRERDALRVAPQTVRAFASGPDGLDLLAFGAPAVSGGENDAEMIDG